MKKLFLILLTALLMTPAAFADTPLQGENTAKPDSSFHIYLCFGQSNMEGIGTIEPIDKTGVNDRFKVMCVCETDREQLGRIPGEWYTAVPPLCRAGAQLSVVDYFGRTMVEYLSEEYKVGIVMVAIGGTGIDCYDKDNYKSYYEELGEIGDTFHQDLMNLYGGNPYAKLVEMGRKAQKDGIIKGILLHQGENNNMQPDWPGKVEKIYRDLLKDLDLDEKEVPLIAGEMVSAAEGGLCAGHNEYVAMLPEFMNAYVVSSEDCEGAADGLHFTSQGYREMGQNYAQVALNSLYDIPMGMPDLPAESLTMENTDLQVQIGGAIPLKLMATFTNGLTENVAPQCEYEVEKADLVRISNGRIRGLLQGCTPVKATYTDPKGNKFSVSFTLNSSCFPFDDTFIYTDLFGGGTYRETTRAFFPGVNGQMGWKYTYGLDMSGYKYLVLKLDKVQKVNANLILYPENNIWTSNHMHPVGEGTTLVIPLQDITYTNGDLAGQPMDISHIMIVALYASASGVIDVADMYLTNNDDYSSEAVHMASVTVQATSSDNATYSLQGVRMATSANLPKGIYIRNGKKFVVR